MTPKEFKAKYWPDIVAACQTTELDPYFVAAQAAHETGWGRKAIGNNLFGIQVNKSWHGLKQLKTTTEYLKDDKQSGKFVNVYSITKMPDGRYKYVGDLYFRDYPSVKDCLIDHAKVLKQPNFIGAWKYKDDPYQFAYAIAKAGYCTDSPETYAKSIGSIAKTIERS